MRTNERSAAITEVTATRQPLSTTRQGTQSRQASPPKEKTVYFCTCVYDLSDPDDPEPVEELQAGKTYLLAITCENRPSKIYKHLIQDGKSIAGNFSLVLSYSYPGASVTTPITPAKEIFTFQAIFDNDKKCEFTLPTDFPSCNLKIMLRLRTPQRDLAMLVTQYTLPVYGRKKVPDMEFFRVSRINQHLPEMTAILLAEIAVKRATRKQYIRLRGWSEAGLQLDESVVVTTIVSIEELQIYRQKKKKTELSPEEILKLLTFFSRNNSPKLLSWLNRLFVDYQEQFNLIITDLTSQEVPWELLEFDPGRYLGAYARVARWLPTQYFRRERELAIKIVQHEGPAISYLDQHLGLDLIKDEQDALQCLTGKPYSSLSALKKRLKDSLEDTGLIYIGCHGIEGRSLGALQQNVPELASIMLEGIYECKPPHLTVFINACESARTIKKSPDDYSNFVDTFLAHCASGFIGTLAQVDIQTASRIGSQILQATLQPGGVQIAEKLRLLRKQAIEQLVLLEQRGSAGDVDYYRVIDTFMYVYYGNPLAQLQLRQREESGT